jgi:hypothetical protein
MGNEKTFDAHIRLSLDPEKKPTATQNAKGTGMNWKLKSEDGKTYNITDKTLGANPLTPGSYYYVKGNLLPNAKKPEFPSRWVNEIVPAGPTQAEQKPVPTPDPTVRAPLTIMPPPPVTLNGAELGNRMKLVVELACSRLGPGMTRDEYIDEMGHWWNLFANVSKTGVFPEVGKTEDDIPTEDEDLPF